MAMTMTRAPTSQGNAAVVNGLPNKPLLETASKRDIDPCRGNY